jgi:hypothetical protein
VGFLLALGTSGIDFGHAAALLAGGVIAAPFAAWLVRHMAPRVLGVAAGGLIVVTNARTILIAGGLEGTPLLAILGGLLAVWVVLVAWTVRKERAARRAERRVDVDAETPSLGTAAA